MKLNFNAQGKDRKRLVESISALTKHPAKFLGVPSCAYQIGDYHLDKCGVLTGPDNLDLEDLLLTRYGFEAVERTYDEPDTYESGLGGMGAVDEIPDIDQHHPGQYAKHDVPMTEAMQRQLDEVLAWEDLRMDGREELGLGRTRHENFQGENGMQASDVPEPDDGIRLVIEMPLTGFTEESLMNLEKMIASKAGLIKKAIGADHLPIERTETTLKFPWFNFPDDPSVVDAYARFISALCQAAKKQKRVTAREKDVESEKFAFRVFLIRLGFVGDEYKAARKILLSKLEGSSAFNTGKETNHA